MRRFFFLVYSSLISIVCLSNASAWTNGIDERINHNVHLARTSLLSAERTLFAAEQAIDAAVVITTSIHNSRLVHSELNRLAEGVPGARALLVIGADGRLLHDSYKFPVLPLDLSDRSYFKEALTTKGIVIGKQVVGRTSGAVFVPIAKRVGDLTFVIVTTPYAFVDLQGECGDCWSSAVRVSDGAIITMFPPEHELVPGILSRLTDRFQKSAQGTLVVRYKHSVFSVVWRRSDRFPLLNVSVRGLTDSAEVEIDIN